MHEILRSWRSISDQYDGDRMFVGEVTVNGAERLARYMRPDELHTTFNLDFLKSPLDVASLRETITATVTAFAAVGAPATWTLLTMLALPGSVYLYQGEELGLGEVEDLPDEAIQDPVWESSQHTVRGRDGCRVPLPWSGEEPPFGFGAGAGPWLPQPAGWAALTAEKQASDDSSMLAFYRRALALRHSLLGDQPLTWPEAPQGVLAFDRGPVRLLLNLSGSPLELTGEVLLASDGDGAVLPTDSAAWVRL